MSKIPTTNRVIVNMRTYYVSYDVIRGIKDLVVQCGQKHICAKDKSRELLLVLQQISETKPQLFAKSSLELLKL